MATVVVAEFMDEAALARHLGDVDVRYDPDLVDRPEELHAALADARGLIVRNRTQVRGALLDAAPKLEVVGRLGVGLDNIDRAACKARGIAVHPATGANDLAVAEWVVTSAMLLLRGAYGASGDVAAGRWPRERLVGREFAHKTLGLVGYGAIARETARRALALGASVVAYDPFVAADDPAWQLATGTVRPVDFDALLAGSDVVSLHVPLTDATRGLIGADALALMKPGAILLNAARGGIVDEAALARALGTGKLGGAGLDVFESEPLDAKAGARFAGLDNVLLTPHVAGVTVESNSRVSEVIAAAVARHLRRG